MTVSPTRERAARAAGCRFHGHVWVYTLTSEVLIDGSTTDYRVERHYVCQNCQAQTSHEEIVHRPHEEYEEETDDWEAYRKKREVRIDVE